MLIYVIHVELFQVLYLYITVYPNTIIKASMLAADLPFFL